MRKIENVIISGLLALGTMTFGKELLRTKYVRKIKCSEAITGSSQGADLFNSFVELEFATDDEVGLLHVDYEGLLTFIKPSYNSNCTIPVDLKVEFIDVGNAKLEYQLDKNYRLIGDFYTIKNSEVRLFITEKEFHNIFLLNGVFKEPTM